MANYHRYIDQIFEKQDLSLYVQLLQETGVLYLYGTGNAQKMEVESLRHLLTSVGKKVVVFFDQGEFDYLKPLFQPNDLLLLLSYKGESSEAISLLKDSHSTILKTMVMTQTSNNSMAKLVDYQLYVPTESIVPPTRRTYEVSTTFCMIIDQLFYDYRQATSLFLGLKGVVFNDNILGLIGLSTNIFPPYLNQLVRTPMIGLVLGLMLIAPQLPNAYAVASGDAKAIMVGGVLPVMGAQGSVVTAILTGYLGAKLERKLRQIMPNSLDLIMTPFITMLVMVVVALMGFAPIVHWLETGLIALTKGLMNLLFGIGGFFVGATYPLAVITGLHHMYVVIETSLLANTGFNQLITLCAMYGFANLGACLAFYTSAKNAKVKQTVMGAFMSQLFGVSEPVLFGVHLRYNLKPLYMMLISSGFGAALLSLFQIQSNSYGLTVLPSYLMYIYSGHQLLVYFVVSLISMALCFFLTKTFAIPEGITVED